MKCCRVVAPMWAAVKHPAFAGRALLVVQPLDENGKDAGASYVAIDNVQAGIDVEHAPHREQLLDVDADGQSLGRVAAKLG